MPHSSLRLESPAELRKMAWTLRQDIIRMIAKANSGHPGGSLSAIDLITTLYFSVLRHNPEDPTWPARDRFILSKGHGCPALYAVLGELGYFDKALFDTLRQLGSPLQGHPELGKLPGVEASTGSLGQGLSLGLGMAEGARLAGTGARVYVLMGDGELDEGQVWEAALYAGAKGLDNVVAVVDVNRQQLDDSTEKILPLEPLSDKWRAFGWHVIELDGHDCGEILAAYREAEATRGRPTVLLARTVKGRGVSFMEHNNEWHGAAPNAEQTRQALSELAAALNA
ncbi:MAG: transketolase [Candidatus Sericytochromatia bacterium]|nr:transketolase [Candidatus Sericytochromatia bacterium]